MTAPRSLADTAKALLAKADAFFAVADADGEESGALEAAYDAYTNAVHPAALHPLLLALVAVSELPERWRTQADKDRFAANPTVWGEGEGRDACAADLEIALAVAEEQGT